MDRLNYNDWYTGTYQSFDDPRDNTEDLRLCKDCQNEFEDWDGQFICKFCEVCDDCKEYKDECECIDE